MFKRNQKNQKKKRPLGTDVINIKVTNMVDIFKYFFYLFMWLHQILVVA